jgi:hypothetical protein
MNRHLLRALAVTAGWLAPAGLALAQPPYQPPFQPGYGVGGFPVIPSARPPLSPYLNLLQGTGNPAVNYFNFTRPALQAQQFFQQPPSFGLPPAGEPFGLASTDVASDPRRNLTGQLPRATGHPTTFMNPMGYFNSYGTIGAPFGRGAGAGAAARPQVGARR